MNKRNYTQEFRNLVKDCQADTIDLFKKINCGNILQVNDRLILNDEPVKSIAYMEDMNILAINYPRPDWVFLVCLRFEDQLAVYNYLRNL